MAAEKQYKYTAKFTQPQTVGTVKLNPKGGVLTERELKNLKKDAYGASLLEKGLLVVGEAKEGEEAPASSGDTGDTCDTGDNTGDNAGSETIPDFDETERN